MSNLIVIPKFEFNAAPAKIEFNYEEVNAALTKYLEKYQDAVVTTETMADDKKLVSELNAEAKAINDLRIAQKKKLSEPISEFEEKMKALHGKYKEVSDGINEQVKAHEQVRLDKCEQMIVELLDKTRTEREVDTKHMLNMEQNLVRLGSLTAKDALAKSARDAIANHVSKEVAFMQQTEKRLLMLENASLRAGLDAPLTRGNVEAFLYDNDDGYQIGLAGLIDSELERQEVARKANEARIKKEQEAQAKAEADKAEAIKAAEAAAQRSREAATTEIHHPDLMKPADISQTEAESHNRQSSEQPVHEEIKTHYTGQPVLGVSLPDMGQVFTPPEVVYAQPQQPQINGDGTITRMVVATFEVTTKSHITDQQVTNRLAEVMAGAGITTLQKIEVI